jgi:integrase
MADTAQRVRRRLDEVFEEAIEQEIVSVNPVAMLRTKLRREKKLRARVSHPAIDFREAPAFIAALRIQAGIAARCLEFTVLTAARTGESIGATWSEFDLERGIWTVPGTRMKGGESHTVHLCDRALAILKDMQALQAHFAFPSPQDHSKQLSNMAMLKVLERMNRVDITVHGFRATFSTWANETAAGRPDVIEACLAHREGNLVRAAYNRARFTAERRELLAAWANYLDGQEATSNVINLPAQRAA